jgi:hypothetical protein
MKRPLSVLVITKDMKTQQEVHNRFDVLTRFPRLRLIGICIRAFFSL